MCCLHMYICTIYTYQYIICIYILTCTHVYCKSQMSKRISRTLETTRFKGATIIPVSAKPGGQEVCVYVHKVMIV